MIAVIQKVSRAAVAIEGKIHSSIGKGLLVLVGIEDADDQLDIDWLSHKISHLRVFCDDDDVMNLNVGNVGGELLIISQFTLHASTKKGNRPSYVKAAHPEVAIPLYEAFVDACAEELKKPVQTGVFGANMKVDLQNDGPVTIIIDTKDKK